MYCVRLIIRTDILHQPASRTMKAQSTSSSFPYSFSIRWRGENDAWQPSKATIKEDKDISKEISEFTSLQRNQPIYRWGGEGKSSPIQIFIPRKSVHLSRFSINRINKISTVIATWSQSIWHQDSKRCQLKVSRILINRHVSCPPTARSPNTSRKFAFMI